MSLKTAREVAGLTQIQAAMRIGVDPSAIAQWETGRTLPLAKRLPVIADVYHCSIDALIAAETPKTPSVL